MLRTGQIRIDGKRAEANTRLASGQEVRIPPLPDGPPPARDQFLVSGEDAEWLQTLVIHRDDSVIVLDKPHGLPVQGGPGITRHLDGMLDALRFGYEDRPRLVHRLDRDTSGVLLIARTPGAAAFLAKEFRGRGVEKTYWAVVIPQPQQRDGRIDIALLKQDGPRGERVMAMDDPDAGRPRHHRFPHPRCRQGPRRLAGAEAADRPDPSTARALRRGPRHARSSATASTAAPRRIWTGFPASCTCMPGRCACRIPKAAPWKPPPPLPPHMKDTFAYFGFEAPKTLKPRRVAPVSKR